MIIKIAKRGDQISKRFARVAMDMGNVYDKMAPQKVLKFEKFLHKINPNKIQESSKDFQNIKDKIETIIYNKSPHALWDIKEGVKIYRKFNPN